MRNSRLKMRMILAGVGCILLLAVAFTVLKGQDPTSTTPDTDSKAEQVEQRADSALPVQIMKPQRQDVSYTITLPANVSPWYQATLYAKVPGYLTSMGFDKGDAVNTARFADPGALIQSGSASATQAVPLYTIMDLETVRVYVSVPQEVALLAKAGVPVVVTTKEMQGKEFKGSITRTTEALDPATRTLLVEIDMPNKERQLQPGTFVSATLYLLEHPNALVIPPTAIMTSGSDKRKSVLVVEQGKAHQIPIKTGIDDGVWVEVVEGLSGNEDIVVVGKAGLTDGQTVKASASNLQAAKRP